MKQVIDGTAYNTETARHLATVDIMGYRIDERGRSVTNSPKKVGTTSLYETRGGAYFMARDYDPEGVHANPDITGQLTVNYPGVTPLTRKQALAWAVSNDVDKIEEMFGKIAEAGDQPGAAILLRLPQTLKLAIEKSAAVAGISTNSWLMRCVERAIASERDERQS